MFSKEESRLMKMEFWVTFGKRTALISTEDGKKKKWIQFRTGIKDLSFKFESDRKYARVCIDIEQKDLVKRMQYWEKLESLKTMLNNSVPAELIWDEEFVLDNGKEISRIYCQLNGVSIFNQNKWADIYDFFVANMTPMEDIFNEYKDFIKDID
ncbi:MAG: DUF4268 domain-containing protein [Ichthyobacteriaceae bacterium]|nr:DUF4268 domain-containing protein [Ichthyobacteriaceae bacterium]